MSLPTDMDDGSDDGRSPARRSVLRSIGAAGAAAAGGAAATGTAAARESTGELAQNRATERHARNAFRSDLGQKLLDQLAAHGAIESPSVDALAVDRVTAEPAAGPDRLTAVEARHEDRGRIVGFITQLETDVFDGPITVRLFPEAGIAGATAERDGEPVVLSPKYDGVVRQADASTQSCPTCSGYEPSCSSHDCDCSRYCSGDMEGKYTAHTVCEDGHVICDDCSLCCDVGCGPIPNW